MMLLTRAADTVERATVTCLLMDVHTTLGQSSRAVIVGLDYLRHLGIEWLPHPTDEEVRCEYDRVWAQLGGRTIEELIELPLMNDPASLATLDVLIKLWNPASFTNVNLFFLTLCKAVNLSLEGGNSDGSCAVYERFGTVAGGFFGDYQAAFRFGQLGCDLVEQRRLTGFQARVYDQFGTHVLPWARHVKAGRDFVVRAFEDANKIGDLTYAAYGRMHLNTNMLVAGDPLIEVQREVEHGLAYAQKMQFGLVIDAIATQLALVRTLRRLTRKFGCFDDEQFDELRIERHFASNPDLALPECWYWIRKLQARLISGDYAAAVDSSLQAQRLLWTSLSRLELAEYHFYSALSRAACCDSDSVDLRQQHLEALAAHRQQIEVWAEHCPETFENRAALIGAETARLEGRTADAMRLYQRAIRSARTNGFVQNEALAFELAARFYETEGFEEIAHLYMRNARYCYLRWGADGKVRQLDELYPYLREDESVLGPTKTIAASLDQLDLTTVIKVSQAISGEIVLEKLLETLTRTAVEQAGAERGVLIFSDGAEQRMVAEATTSSDLVSVQLRDERVTAELLPESVLHHVLRTRESVILDDAAQSPFGADPYIRRQQARSALCLPLLNQAKVMGVLFLENSLTASAFAPGRIAVLKLLASQAAISLENTRLYRDLAEREARIRRLVDSDVIGIVIWDLNGRLLDANDAFLRMVQYDRMDLDAGLRWFDMTPPEWQDVHALEELEELQTTGMMQTREKEFFRKDGSRVPVLIGAAVFEGQADQGVAYILDLTERKRTEAQARESERRYREIQADLAHANRVATTGQLSASIAHEVNQPLTAMITNTQAALRWLEALPPNLEEIRDALASILRNGTRASDVIGRIRALVKKTPPRRDLFEINDAIREVIELALNEAGKNGVSMQVQLAERLPLIEGDRVQLQQVVLNMVVNAIEAMSPGEGGSRELLMVTEKGEPDGVVVSVQDCGPGLAPEFVERVFEAFYTTKSGGMGMGLSICRSIVEAHGGHVWTKPNSPRGAVFGFSLPKCNPFS